VSAGLHARALAALLARAPEVKAGLTEALWDDYRAGRLSPSEDDPAPIRIPVPGRPERPLLVAPAAVPRRSLGSPEGHAALLHAVAHIEFNAINLALDCVFRFRGLEPDFYADWLRVAREEAYHFGLVQSRLHALGKRYGDFPAHDGLWQMACKTEHDPLARMALVPRVLEARGLDATPPIIEKLRGVGDRASIEMLDIILRDEIGHVAIGDRWFRHFCAGQGLEPEQTYRDLMLEFDAPWPRRPLNEQARLSAGFSVTELAELRTRAR
jgi:uncharacterized ferritin-like protein (DUF455 family)